ncbi:O-antigen ligase family protein [Pseudomonas capeferrum]|uniref:O-antigen ligase family protein n=1 Tax=Pseudomonas capeferrum TaxID=1495066 RepID=UPI0015E3A28C|nr:O-antigen ligase family protein [Pseudomonas capeferrum]MBA1202903.1 O-antigen ligase family protein [Pseudomonas capeferrum]
MLYQKRWARAWLGFGFLWFLSAIALAPSNKIYQQGLILFLWLPTLVMGWSSRHVFLQAWRRQPALWASILALLAWCALSLAWTTSEDGARDGKRLLYILLFLMAFPMLAQLGQAQVRNLLRGGGLLLGVAGLASILHYYVIQGWDITSRLEGIGEISHPILGAYVVGAAVIWMAHAWPRNRPLMLFWVLALVCLGAFVILSQSRGAALALVITMLLAPLWYRNRWSSLLGLKALLATGAAWLLMHDLIMARGASFRPEILEASLRMIAEHPWGGLGLGAFYRVEAAGYVFDHTHNMFTHIAIEQGIPGLLLWGLAWFCALREIWRARASELGKMLLGLWIFSTLAMQFDAASLTGTPRAEWFVSWLPLGMALMLPWAHVEEQACGKISGSN